MGVVYEAVQVSLNRPVALKLIRDGPGAGPELTARFRAEAEAIARLQHPNIVQVFATGEWEGRPYLVLEYVPGGSLHDLTDRDPQPATEAAGFVEKLARAAHYAHQRGIVHRDLKPANVLLAFPDQKGEAAGRRRLSDCVPKVVDFGLARQIEPTGSEGEQTQSGAVLGTPLYMSPEQAQGRSREIGPSTDIYALGVILYELLTGRPPFQGTTAHETLQQVCSREPVPPRRLVPRVPRDLETICLKCLEKEPARRYASAEALADDLECFVQGRPILARPVGPVGRLARWSRRQPALAGLASALGLVLMGSLLALTWLWRVAVHERGLAEHNLRTASEAVDRHFTLLSEVTLGREPGSQPLKKQLLEDARRYFQGFLDQSGRDPALRIRAADATARVARITGEIGSREEALAGYERARELYEGLVRERPGDRELREKLATCGSNLGVFQSATGRNDEAFRSYGRALALRERLAAEAPGRPDFRNSVAATHINVGNLQARLRRPAEARASYERAIDLLESLARDHTDRPAYQAALSAALNNLGVLHKEQTGDKGEALRCYERALVWRGRLARAYPAEIAYADAVAASYNNLGVLHTECGDRPEEALHCLGEARTRREHLARDNPAVTDYQFNLADTANNLAILLIRLGKRDEALRAFEEALAVRERLAAGQPRVLGFQRACGDSYNNIGRLMAELGRPADALQAHRKALEIRRRLAAEHGDVPALRADEAASAKLVAELTEAPGVP
jgi:tetratricopeptide (TPR) repeat protein